MEDRTDLSCFAATAFLYVFIIRVGVIWSYPYRTGFSEAMCSDPLGEVRGRAEREQPLARCLGPVASVIFGSVRGFLIWTVTRPRFSHAYSFKNMGALVLARQVVIKWQLPADGQSGISNDAKNVSL